VADFLEHYYGEYEHIEEEFQKFLDESLYPRGPDYLYELVDAMGLPPGTPTIDVGCGDGEKSIQLATRFGFSVLGIDPVPYHIELATAAANANPRLSLRFKIATAEAIPADDGSVELVWLREVLYHLRALETTFSECFRVLRSGGRMLIYHNFGKEQTESGNHEPEAVDAALARADFVTDEVIELGPEFGEYAEEQRGEPGRRLLHAARLLRDPDRYIKRFGRRAYDIMLDDCMWHVNRMIGKLNGRIYLLHKP
jgi:SAM-dependent methyltransferase